ncbi:hypothetical protein J5N97_028467 [Dioscorea zingiberensis]|uniref:Elongation of fatty acids protein 3-like n=1 Tax=Dioscorea zingiberensis TaxID=325984 RepID=A0A9D5H4W1_9LILI|nr:hypothetical protein J5N97_028467 [Dioscorea zingiberensis]
MSNSMLGLGMMNYWLAEHPAVISFRWSHSASWGSTWSFLISAMSLYVLSSLLLHLLLFLLRRRSPIPLGPLPAIHSLAMASISATIFTGLLVSSLAEIRDTRWLWRRSKTTPLQWFLCFPLGTRPSGRVFFWSYAFYLSRFLHLLRTFFSILGRRRLTVAGVSAHCIHICMSFLWLEFSQSFQVLAILATTFASVVVYGYRFWVGVVGLPVAGRVPVVLGCQVALMGCNVACHLGVLLLHLCRGGCNGIGAWGFNSLLNAALLLLFFNSFKTLNNMQSYMIS